jgi:hypothetical protein
MLDLLLCRLLPLVLELELLLLRRLLSPLLLLYRHLHLLHYHRHRVLCLSSSFFVHDRPTPSLLTRRRHR